MTSISDAQLDMREGYYGGATGILASATAWLAAGLVALSVNPRAGILTLVIGGMFVFPASLLLCKAIGCTGKLSKGNPLTPLAIAGTIWMILSIPIAVGAAFTTFGWFFPAMLLVIGSRYLTFSTLYGMRIYWIFGAALIAASVVLFLLRAPAFMSALTGALIEYVFGIMIFISHRAQQSRPK